MDTLQVKIIVMNTLTDLVLDKDEYKELCEEMYQWLSEEFKVEDEEKVSHLHPVN